MILSRIAEKKGRMRVITGQILLVVWPVIHREIIRGNGASKILVSIMEVLKLNQRKGIATTATVFVLLALIGNVATLSVAIGGFQDVLGMNANSNAAETIENKIVTPVRQACYQGTNADERTPTFTLSSKVNVSLVSEENDPLNDQSIRAILVDESAQLVNSEPIGDCVIEFSESPKDYRVFEKEEPYQLTINNAGTQDDKPATSISVEER